MSTVSVVIPTYNAARYLAEALDSVRRQTRPVDEVIVVDDHSADESPAIARRWGATCLATPVNSGPAAARNVGIRAATGSVVAFLDADDLWEPAHCETVVGLLDRHPGAVLAFGRERRFGGWSGEHPRVLPPDEAVDGFLEILRKNPIPQMGVAVRRDALLAAGGYDETMRYSEDYDLWLRLARRHLVVCTADVTCHHRGHGAQASVHDDRLARGAFEARHRSWEEACRTESAEFVTRVEAVIREAWERYLRSTWRNRDRRIFDAALGLHPLVPGSEAILRRWMLRRRALWLPYVGAGWVWGRLPAGVRSALRGGTRPAG